MEEGTRRSPWVDRLVAWVDRVVNGAARHWLAVVNMALLIYVALPVMAPLFMAWGWKSAGQAIYWAYTPFCHQLPERSFFLFGEQPVYTLPDLLARGLPGGRTLDALWARRLFIGDPSTGYKMAFCQRDLALYGSVLLGGLIYSRIRKRVSPLPWKAFVLLLIPLAVDGGAQLVGIRESTWGSRVFTGVLSGLAVVWALYPRLDKALSEVR